MAILPNSSKMVLTVSRSHIRTAFLQSDFMKAEWISRRTILVKTIVIVIVIVIVIIIIIIIVFVFVSSSSLSSSSESLSGVSTSRFVIQFLYSSLGAIWDIDSFLGAKNNLSEGESIIIVQHSIFIFILLLFYFLWICGVHIQVEFTFIYLLMIHMIIHQSTSESNIYQKSSPTVLYIVSQ